MISACARLRITAAVVVVTLALSSAANADDVYASLPTSIYRVNATGQSARFARNDERDILNQAEDMALGADGALYVAVSYPNKIARFDANGVGTFVTTSGLNAPRGLAFDPSGNLYVSNFGNNTIVKFAAGVGAPTVFASTLLNQPEQIAFDREGNLFVANFGGGTIARFTPDGSGSIFADGLDHPRGLAFGPGGDLFVSSGLTTTTALVESLSTDGARSAFSRDYAFGLAFDSAGALYGADTVHNRILRFGADGAATTFGTVGQAPKFIVVQTPEPTLTSLGLVGLLLNRRRARR